MNEILIRITLKFTKEKTDNRKRISLHRVWGYSTIGNEGGMKYGACE
ncbi:hypothetical protein ERICI_03959 [Paenibacillus larvae subsp. larvae]|uniref:Uncharacterized protein n=1 Tax=Paenibacillus larvae subsp. larvae DSM 25430 TaxID=697284 RepID=V9WE19_9BACL|nr:hypothetical protein ERIC2_c36351 [Paenibacillus larvae subsp. larvae DSM 25430]AVF23692.1 hypothetical protein ERICI_03959 [Paenibacillus larvae subsp. larvae]ETK29638.1 hypothetical protein ERIC1_1c31950 [Paenibacillus larvae subsp. larvae DSM 25719]